VISDYLKNLVKVLGIGAAFASIPLFASLAELQPPWPPAIGIVSAGLVLLASLIVWEWTRRSRIKVRRRLILLAATLTIGGLIGYLFLYSFFIEPIPGTHVRVVRGFVCTADAQRVYRDACPDLPREALQNSEWEAVALWTRSSVTWARVGLTAAWLVFTSGLIAAVGAIVAGRKF
jgi:uncharacterized membrane protein YfcA